MTATHTSHSTTWTSPVRYLSSELTLATGSLLHRCARGAEVTLYISLFLKAA